MKNLEYQKEINPKSIYNTMSVEELLDHILENYKKAKLLHVDRTSTEWGGWSRQMNLCTRKRIDDNNPDALALKYVFEYWINKSQALRLAFRGGIINRWKMKTLAKEAEDLRKIILNGELEDLKLDLKEVL